MYITRVTQPGDPFGPKTALAMRTVGGRVETVVILIGRSRGSTDRQGAGTVVKLGHLAMMIMQRWNPRDCF